MTQFHEKFLRNYISAAKRVSGCWKEAAENLKAGNSGEAQKLREVISVLSCSTNSVLVAVRGRSTADCCPGNQVEKQKSPP